MILKHYAIFGKNIKALDWENLRNDESETPYFIPYTKEKYIKRVDSDFPTKTTEIIINEVNKLGYKKVFSIGSGLASQEYQIKKFSDLTVIISDFTPSILRLKTYGVFDDCIQLDVLNGNIPIGSDHLLLLPRIDTEFNDEQLISLFLKFKKMGIKNICFIPAQLMSLDIIISELKNRIFSIIRRKALVFCGYTRSERYFNRLWYPYKIEKKITSDLTFFFLELKNK